MAVIGELATLITAKTEPFTKGLNTATKKAKGFSGTISRTMGGALTKVTGLLSGTTAALAGLGGAFTIGGIVAQSVKLASAAEDMQTAYAVYLKDLDKAKVILKELNDFSAATPFEPTEVKEAGKQLLAFGFQAKDLMGLINVIGNLAAGSQKPMADFVDILGKVKASGVASLGDVMRLADRGVPIFQALSQQLGVATSEVRSLVSTGKVGFEDIWAAVKGTTEGTGLFAGSLDKLSKTTSGLISTLKGEVNAALTDMGKSIIEGLDLKVLTARITELVQTYKQDIVDATTQGVQLFMAAFERVPEWVRWLQMAVKKLEWGGKFISQWSRRDVGIGAGLEAGAGASDFTMGLGQGIATRFGWRNGLDPTVINRQQYRGEFSRRQEELRLLERSHNNLRMQYQAEVAARGVREEHAATTDPQQKEQKQQTKTLDDILREQQKANEQRERQIRAMQEQNQVVWRF